MSNYIYLVIEDDYESRKDIIIVTTDLRLALRKCNTSDKELHIWLDDEELDSIDGSYNPENIKLRFEKSTYLQGYHDDLIEEVCKVLDEYFVTYQEERLENERHQAELIRKTELEQFERLKAKYGAA